MYVLLTAVELRSTENAQCTIMMRFIYKYVTLYLLHATPYVRMLRRIYDPKRISRINYTIFPRYLEEDSSFTTYLGKLIIILFCYNFQIWCISLVLKFQTTL